MRTDSQTRMRTDSQTRTATCRVGVWLCQDPIHIIQFSPISRPDLLFKTQEIKKKHHNKSLCL